MALPRILRHLVTPARATRRAFPAATLDAIESAIAASEARHAGELRFVVEAGLDLPDLLVGVSARARAEELFSRLRVWDTEGNSGVLIYVLLADRRVEIVADRGIATRLPQAQWDRLCRAIEADYAAGRFEAGTLTALQSLTALLAAHFPAAGDNPNELPDRPLLR